MPDPKPPSSRRCQRILQAHRLRCQGLTLRQIAEQLGCAHATVAAYLRDLQTHRRHILETFAADQLVDQIHLLTQPGQDPAQHHQHAVVARELRLILTALPNIQAAHERRQQQSETAAAIALARSRQPNATDPDGHSRLDNGRCALNCPMCKPHIYEEVEARQARRYAQAEYEEAEPDDLDDDLNPTEQSPTDDDPSPQTTPESEQIRTNLNKSEHPEAQFSRPDNEIAPPPPKRPKFSQPEPKLGSRYPVSSDNPFGYNHPGSIVTQIGSDAARRFRVFNPHLPYR